MRVLYITADWSRTRIGGDHLLGGAGWYRCYLPARALNAHGGVETAICPHLAVMKGTGEIRGLAWDGTRLGGADVVVLQRWMGEDGERIVSRARAYGQAVVNDVDDWFDGLDPSNAAFRASHPKMNPGTNRNHYRRTLAASTLLTVSTPYLARRLAKLRRPISVVRNAIDADRYTPYALNRRYESARPVVGWVGATPWRSGDLETLRGILGPALRDSGGTWYHGGYIPGGADAGELAGIPDDVPKQVELMRPISEYPALFGPLDVGLVPLHDTPFNHAKSWIKGLEYAAAGVPFIYPEWHAEYRTLGVGRPANRPVDWRRTLDFLRDPARRRAVAERAQRTVVADYSIETRWADWASAYGRAVALAASDVVLPTGDTQ